MRCSDELCVCSLDDDVDMCFPDPRSPKPCHRCGEVCTYDGWDHVHKSGRGIDSCPPPARLYTIQEVAEELGIDLDLDQ